MLNLYIFTAAYMHNAIIIKTEMKQKWEYYFRISWHCN